MADDLRSLVIDECVRRYQGHPDLAGVRIDAEMPGDDITDTVLYLFDVEGESEEVVTMMAGRKQRDDRESSARMDDLVEACLVGHFENAARP